MKNNVQKPHEENGTRIYWYEKAPGEYLLPPRMTGDRNVRRTIARSAGTFDPAVVGTRETRHALFTLVGVSLKLYILTF